MTTENKVERIKAPFLSNWITAVIIVVFLVIFGVTGFLANLKSLWPSKTNTPSTGAATATGEATPAATAATGNQVT